MSFSRDVKILRKRYFDAVKQFYQDEHIIIKMILQRRKYDDLYEADLAFRTCMVPEFSDKNINRLFDIDVARAVDKLRARARGCAYTASVVQTLLENQISKSQQMSCDEIGAIRQQLLDMASLDIQLSDKWAKDVNINQFDKHEFDEVYKQPHSKYLEQDWFCK